MIDGEEVQFAWDPQSFNVVGEYDDMGNEDVAYGPQTGMDDPWVMERESGAYFFQTDHLNSVTELTDENEAVQNEYRYKAFGEALAAVEMVENEYQFTARRRDGVDGIQFNRFRHYQAEFGRWNQWDRIRYQDGPNMYGYVGNRPIIFVDQDGKAWSWAATGIGAGLGAIGGFAHGITSQTISYATGGGFGWSQVGQSTAVGALGGATTGALTGAVGSAPENSDF